MFVARIRPAAALSVLLLSLGVIGCDGPKVSDPGATAPSPPTASLIVTVEPGSVTLAPGESVQLRGAVRTPQGIWLPTLLVWSSSDTSVVTVSGTGMVTARRQGQAAVLANAYNGRRRGVRR